ncbi:hypothetical protein HOLleu_02587 [Holothuria leucospilota]|uniref:Uncharacterized protein n=1 Tax=Holothuria leucospilota TaxID=206669 RepID=A0A9Q1CRU3_HOLLE|nr:hypothetical protein HOLleu_02587 [Holothuria leucospilota]
MCFEVRFVSAKVHTLIRIFSKTTGNKRFNNVLHLCPLYFNTSPAWKHCSSLNSSLRF